MVNASSVSSFNYKLINTDLKFGLIGKPSSTLIIIIFIVLLILLTCMCDQALSLF